MTRSTCTIDFFHPQRGSWRFYSLWLLVFVSLFFDNCGSYRSSSFASDVVATDGTRGGEAKAQEESTNKNIALANDDATTNDAVAPLKSVDQTTSPPVEEEVIDKEASRIELEEWLSVVTDNTLELHKREMPAYWRLISLAKNESFESLTLRARKSPAFSEFYLAAPKHRGELVSLDVNIRRVLKYPASEGNPANVDNLYEIWGWTNQAKSWLYVFVTPELPEGMDENTLLNRTATFTGFFLKLQGYHSGMARQNNQPLVAPLLIGRIGLTNAPEVRTPRPNLQVYYIMFAVLGIFGLSYLTKYLVSRQQKRVQSRTGSTANSSSDGGEKFDWIDSVDRESDQSKNRD